MDGSRISANGALALAAALALLSGCAGVARPERHVIATATLAAGDGAPRGTATLAAVDDRIELRVNATGLTPGEHGIHLHSVGRCDAADFATAGAHLNPEGHQHGSLNPAGSHLGDLPNLAAASDGRANLSTLLAQPRADIEARLFDEDGTALVIHADPDDYLTDPSGNSGKRIACGVFRRAP